MGLGVEQTQSCTSLKIMNSKFKLGTKDSIMRHIKSLKILSCSLNTNFILSFNFARLETFSFIECKTLGTTNGIYPALWDSLNRTKDLKYLNICITNRLFDWKRLFDIIFKMTGNRIRVGHLTLKGYGLVLNLKDFLTKHNPLEKFD